MEKKKLVTQEKLISQFKMKCSLPKHKFLDKKQGDKRKGRMRGDRHRRLHQFANVLYEYGHSCPSVVSQ